MSELHPNRIVFDAYDALWHKIFYDTKTNGFVVVHVEHGKQELAQNLAVALRLARLGERVELLENTPDGLTADATRNGEVWEFKTTNGSYRSVQSRMRKGRKQARKILMVLPEFYEHTDVLRGILSTTNSDMTQSFECVDLLLHDEKLVNLTYEAIKKRDFKNYWAAIS